MISTQYCVPPKSNAWKLEEHKEMQQEEEEEEVLLCWSACLDTMMRKDNKILLMGEISPATMLDGRRWKRRAMEGRNAAAISYGQYTATMGGGTYKIAGTAAAAAGGGGGGGGIMYHLYLTWCSQKGRSRDPT